MVAFVDTNVLVYVHDHGEPAKRDAAIACLRAEPDHVVSAQVLGELFVTLTRKLATAASPGLAAQIVRQAAARRVIPIDRTLIDRALDLQAGYPIAFWDALIVAAAASAGCDTLLTEDLADGDTILGVRVENPFRGVGD